MKNFNDFNLPEGLKQSLVQLNFTTPTPIQFATIPLALEDKDILGTAQTGTGKTYAFGIPLIAKLMRDPQSSALVLTPTRELAAQVMKAIQNLIGRKSDIKSCLLIGGDPINKQLYQLRSKPRLFVGTPGRINDHIERGTLNLSNVNFLVLDETDRMLDMGFSIQIERIIKHLNTIRQTLLFSATLPKDIMKIADSYLSKPERIAIGSTSTPCQNIKQDIMYIAEEDKYSQLVTQLTKRNGSILVFVKTKHGAEKLARKIRADGHDADAIHGDLRHSKRESVIKGFRNNQYRILIATDIAARGLDIPHIEHVINFDLPQCPEDYIHRIGRTARAGAEGAAICFIAPSDKRKWFAINKLINPEAANSNEPSEPRNNRKKPFNQTKPPFSNKFSKDNKKRRNPRFA